MKLRGPRRAERNGWVRIVARLIPERAPGPARDLWFEVRPGDAGLLEDGWEPFAAAAYPLALHAGERRLAVDGPLCGRLAAGLPGFGSVLQAGRGAPPRFEHRARAGPPTPGGDAATALMLSGGVDSLALLRSDRLRRAHDDPRRIRVGVTVFGLGSHDLVDDTPVETRADDFDAYTRTLRRLGTACDLRVVPVRTNVRHLYPDFATWWRMGWAAGTLAAGLAVAGGVRALWLASDGVPDDAGPERAQQFHVHLLSTARTRVRLGLEELGRYDRTALVADWPEAGGVVRPCTWYHRDPDGRVNCGVCEKCVRTMLTLLALGRLGEVGAFERDDLEPADLEVLRGEGPAATEFYAECLAPLRASGRDDLVRSLEDVIAHRQGRDAAAGRSSRPGRLARAFRRLRSWTGV